MVRQTLSLQCGKGSTVFSFLREGLRGKRNGGSVWIWKPYKRGRLNGDPTESRNVRWESLWAEKGSFTTKLADHYAVIAAKNILRTGHVQRAGTARRAGRMSTLECGVVIPSCFSINTDFSLIKCCIKPRLFSEKRTEQIFLGMVAWDQELVF